MYRKTYETEEDKQREQGVADSMQKILGEDIIVSDNLGISYRLDRVLLKDKKIIGWVEIKCPRKESPSTMWQSYKISLRKIKDGLVWSRITKAPFYLVVKFSNGIKYAEIKLEEYKYYEVEWGGRWKSARDKGDMELMASIPIELFSSLEFFI